MQQRLHGHLGHQTTPRLPIFKVAVRVIPYVPWAPVRIKYHSSKFNIAQRELNHAKFLLVLDQFLT